MKKIIHAHNYGHNNIGDDAMAANVFGKLSKISNHVFSISTYAPPPGQTDDRTLDSLSGLIHNWHNPLIKIFIIGAKRLRMEWLYRVYVWLFCQRVEVLAHIHKTTRLKLTINPRIRKLLDVFSTYDIYVRSGSGSINDIWFWSSMVPQYTEVKAAKIYGLKVYFTGQGLGPLSTPYRLSILRNFIDLVDRITLRDNGESEELIKYCGGALPVGSSVGDDAHDSGKIHLPRAIDNIFDTDGRLVVCQFRPSNYEVALPDSMWRTIAAQLKQIVEKIGAKAVLISFSYGQMSDLDAARKIVKYASHPAIVSLDYQPDYKEARSLLAKADIAIGQSYHFGVFALSENVPFVGLYSNEYYRSKLSGLLSWYDRESWALDEKQILQLGKVVEAIALDPSLEVALRKVNRKFDKSVNAIFGEIAS